MLQLAGTKTPQTVNTIQWYFGNVFLIHKLPISI